MAITIVDWHLTTIPRRQSMAHQGAGIGNRVLDQSFVPMTEGIVRRKRELGGIITSYYREAA